ncbi:MAG TPA: sigma-70 family RNA polymerase sigma factor [Gaiellaceae bacterium]|nr:sigma-70 family RNA polymerase sigma factor [Gaiellaceae bacterium]
MSAELTHLVHAAGAGDQAAWNAIVERFSGLLWATVRAHRLGPSDSAEVVQTTWLRLVEQLDRVRDPDRLGGWLATTARNECLRLIRQSRREVVTDDLERYADETGTALDRDVLASERDRLLWSAFAALGERCQALLRILMADTAPSYQEVSAALGMPVGAIGPTRQRCLERLRRDPQLADLNLDAGEAR